MNTTFKTLLACGVFAAGAWLCQPQAARAAVVPINFQGGDQNFTANVTGSGNLFANGNGVGPGPGGVGTSPFVFTEPLNHPLALLNKMSDKGGTPGVSAETDPRSVSLPKIDAPFRSNGGAEYVYYDPSTGDGTPGSGDQVGDPFTIDGGGNHSAPPPKVFGYSQTQFIADGGSISDIQGLDLDISNGASTAFALSKVTITSTSPNPLLANIWLDVTGSLKGLDFQQTGAATLVPTGAGTGTFSVLGTLTAVAGDLQALAFGILPIDVDDQTFTQPFAMTGTYKITGNPNDPNAKIELDGNSSFSIGLATATFFTFENEDVIPLTISAAIDLGASINFDFGYHLERVGIIPEPGSIVLLGLGMVSIIPVWMHRRRKQRKS